MSADDDSLGGTCGTDDVYALRKTGETDSGRAGEIGVVSNAQAGGTEYFDVVVVGIGDDSEITGRIRDGCGIAGGNSADAERAVVFGVDKDML